MQRPARTPEKTQDFVRLRAYPEQKGRYMKKSVIGILAIVALVFALAFPVAVPAAPPAPKPQPAAHPAAAPEPHPEIREAIASLRRAREHLNHAAHDFGGHRVEAIHAVDAAIGQLETCIKYDR